jgi:ABC-type microcin C transport system duplicated ATPase subunit YejF
MNYLFICHDMAIVRHFAHRVAVMREGRVAVEASASGSYGLMKSSAHGIQAHVQYEPKATTSA